MGVLMSTAGHPFDVVHHQDKVIVSTHIGHQVGCRPSSEASLDGVCSLHATYCWQRRPLWASALQAVLCNAQAVHHALASEPL